MLHPPLPEPMSLSKARGLVTYCVTTLLLAAAWHARFAHGLWIVEAIAGVVGIALALFAFGGSWRTALALSKRNAAAGIGLGLFLVIATQLSARLLLPYMPPVLAETRRLYALMQGPFGAAHYAPLVALVVVAEELVYRGVVTTLCEQRLRPMQTVVCATALYAVPLVASGSWLLVAIGVTLGACWTVARLRSQSLLVTLLAHYLWSCSTFVVFPLA